MTLVSPPRRPAWYLRFALWIARRATGKDPLPGRLLTLFPKGAIGVGIFEAVAAHAPADLDARPLAIARIVASVVGGCPFCIDMNAASWQRAGLTTSELASLFRLQWPASLSPREHAAAAYSVALSQTPVVVAPALVQALREQYTDREIVVLATTIAQVNFWTRFNQGLGVPAAGFFDESVCALPTAAIPDPAIPGAPAIPDRR